MSRNPILDKCLEVTGSFENGTPNYQGVTGNFDGQGISVGVLQWCAGQGSLGFLLKLIQDKIGAHAIDDHFGGLLVSSMISMPPSSARDYAILHFNDKNNHIIPAVRDQWVSLLSTPEAIEAQVTLAETSILHKARELAEKFCPEDKDNLRVIAFFFDLVTQSGDMHNARGHVDPIDKALVDTTEALAFASPHPQTHALWGAALQTPLDKQLFWYAYKRSRLSKTEFVWDAFSRRGSIALRCGFVHGKRVDFSQTLP